MKTIHSVPDDGDYNDDAAAAKGQVKSSKFNLSKMREAAKQYTAESGFHGKGELITIPVYGPPPSDQFIRVRDDNNYWIECATLDWAPENGRKATYFIATELTEHMDNLPPKVLKEVKWSRLYTAIINEAKSNSFGGSRCIAAGRGSSRPTLR